MRISNRVTAFHIFNGLGTTIGDYVAAVCYSRSRLVGLDCTVYILSDQI